MRLESAPCGALSRSGHSRAANDGGAAPSAAARHERYRAREMHAEGPNGRHTMSRYAPSPTVDKSEVVMVVTRICRRTTRRAGARRNAPVRDSTSASGTDPEHEEAVQEARSSAAGAGARRRSGSPTRFEGLEHSPNPAHVRGRGPDDALGLENSMSRVAFSATVAQAGVMLLQKGEHEERLVAIESVLGPKLKDKEPKKRGWSR